MLLMGLMGYFSYLLTCSKAKTFGYYSEEFACIFPVLCRKRLSTRQREFNFSLTVKTNPVLQQPHNQEVSTGLGFNNSSQMRVKLSIIIPAQRQSCHLHTPMGNLPPRDCFRALCLTLVLTEMVKLEQECPWMASAVFCFHRINCPVWESLAGKSQLSYRSSSSCLLFPCTQPQTTLTSPFPREVLSFVYIHWETMMQGFSSHGFSTVAGISPTQFNMRKFVRRNR